MDANVGGPQCSTRHSTNSSSSAVDLSGTGLGIVVPQSPTLRPSSDDGSRAYTRRRLSWSNVETGQDPPRLDLPTSPEPGPSHLATSGADPFSLSIDRLPWQDVSLFSTSGPDTSFTSLRSTLDSDADTVKGAGYDSDETRLTRKTLPKVDGRPYWPEDSPVDSERSAGISPRRQRRYTTSSPLQRTGTAISKAFRRASTRVANVRGHRPSVRLQDDSGDSDSDSTMDGLDGTTRNDVGERFVHGQFIPLRGRALGFLGPTNPLRLRLYTLLIHPYACLWLNLHSLRQILGAPS